ncbi:MAG: hypothetical protein FWH22_09440 [Fibromonadales bacterium]|nr:hypothetical protein [Fibromonadales bacterium]
MRISFFATMLAAAFSLAFGNGIEIHSRLANGNLFGNEIQLHLRIHNNSSASLDLSKANLTYMFK